MYKDGNSFYSVSHTATLQDSSSDGKSIIGANQETSTSSNGFTLTTHSQFLNGRVGELYCYNKALTASEMKQMYNATKGRFSV